MRAAGQQLYAGDGAAVGYNSVYASQQQYGPRPANMPGPGHMGPAPGVAQQSPRADDAMGAGLGPMKAATGAKTTMFAGQQQQQRSAPYPNPHRYMQSRRPQFINGQSTEVRDHTAQPTIGCASCPLMSWYLPPAPFVSDIAIFVLKGNTKL